MDFHRVRLQLDFPPMGLLQRCWFLYDTNSCRTVSDLAHLIAKRFRIANSEDLQLFVEGFLLPPGENIHIVRDNDIIRVAAAQNNPIISVYDGLPAAKRVRASPSFSSSSDSNEAISVSDVLNMPPTYTTSSFISSSSSTFSSSSSSSSSHSSFSYGTISFSLKNSKLRPTDSREQEKKQVGAPVSSQSGKGSRTRTARMKKSVHTASTSAQPRNTTTTTTVSSSSSSSSASSSSSSSSSSSNESEGDNSPKILRQRNHSANPHPPQPATKPPLSMRSEATVSPPVASSSTASKAASNIVTAAVPPKNKLKKSMSQSSGRGVHIRFHSSSSSEGESSSPNEVLTSATRPQAPTESKRTPQGTAKKPASKHPTSSKKTPSEVVGGSDDLFEAHSKVYTGGLSSTPAGGNSGRSPEDGARGRAQQLGQGRRKGRGRGGKRALTAGKGRGGGKQSAISRGEGGEQQAGDSAVSVSQSENSVPPQRDYSNLPDLLGAPRVGDKIAFKTLELSATYTPVHSEFKEGEVLSCSPSANSLVVRLSEDTMKKEIQKAAEQRTGKFALPTEDTDEDGDGDLNPEVELELSSLVTAKFLP